MYSLNRSVFTLTLLLSLAFYSPAEAKKYNAGTAGFLYEACKTTLSDSKNLAEAHDSYCGAFVEGYVMGLMVINSGNIPKPSTSDSCRIDKEKAYTHINNRFCTLFPDLNPDNSKAGNVIETISLVIDRWAKEKKTNLNESVLSALTPILSPGPFCNRLETIKDDIKGAASYKTGGKTDGKTDNAQSYTVSWELKQTTWPQLLGAKSLVSLDKKYAQCVQDIQSSNHKRAAFKGTKCGAEILGFMAGVRADSHIQSNRVKTTNLCKKPIDRLYDSLDAGQTMCVRAKTDPLLVAKIFTKNYKLIKGKKKAWSWSDFFEAGDLGAVGYETIYRGFLCRNESELTAANRK